MTELRISEEFGQPVLSSKPYDRWISPNGNCTAEFHRVETGYLMRFPDEADFFIDRDLGNVTARPADQTDRDHILKLYRNAVVPVIGNHDGGLFLHGSAVAINGAAIVFLGQSRSGKTTLAGAFAKNGNSLLTEDVIDLVEGDGGYRVRPVRSKLRLFPDSAEFLFNDIGVDLSVDGKAAVEGGDCIRFADNPTRLAAVFILGNDPAAPLSVAPLSLPQALPAVIPHAFVLDVEDRQRIKAHFGRLADLAEMVPIFAIDYPRRYAALTQVCEAVTRTVLEGPR
ncbi:hypothetical protein [Erythrobacter sp. THAF29]|uniref:hypothetical protein n=1 Tax=Erythrobacter sp. THAF29 TaxID=2587851 RepID=UPI001268CF9B|nr:hypothetical protein [Erythrobacter sp. THAF29]QFT75984.1 hypothetical protein FIU90_00375 [Erythrobacter sp. THAF29]